MLALLMVPLIEMRAAYAADETLLFDLNRNLSSRQTLSGTTLFGYDPLDQVPTYDAAGHMTGDGGGRIFRYNDQGQLAQALVNGVVVGTYSYNASGQRTRKESAQGTTVYLYQPDGKLLLETNGVTGSLQTLYLYRDDMPVAIVRMAHTPANSGVTETITYLSTDYLSVPRKGTDSQGREVWRWESDAFGSSAPLQDPGGTGTQTLVNLRFPGQYYDAETGLHYNGQRYYDPTTGRYTQPDPIGLRGGRNRFGYVNGNPLRFIDPRGLDCSEPLGCPNDSSQGQSVAPNQNGCVTAECAAGLPYNSHPSANMTPQREAQQECEFVCSALTGIASAGIPGSPLGFIVDWIWQAKASDYGCKYVCKPKANKGCDTRK